VTIRSVAMNPQKAQCMEWFVKIKLVTQAQRCFRTVSQDATIENINAYLV